MHGSDDSDIPLVKALQEIEKRKANVKTSLRDRSGGWSRRQESAEDELDDEDIDDSGGISSGWYPEIFTRAPSPLEMASMQAMMLGTAGQNAGKGAGIAHGGQGPVDRLVGVNRHSPLVKHGPAVLLQHEANGSTIVRLRP